MIPRKKKTCKFCGEQKYMFSNGLCLECWKSENPPNFKKTAIEKKPYKIKQVSSTQEKRLAKYRELRKIYLQNHPNCEARLTGCRLKSNQIHHKGGRDGNNLFKHFLALCDHCHHVIEMEPEMAKKEGFSISRIKTDEDEQ